MVTVVRRDRQSNWRASIYDTVATVQRRPIARKSRGTLKAILIIVMNI